MSSMLKELLQRRKNQGVEFVLSAPTCGHRTDDLRQDCEACQAYFVLKEFEVAAESGVGFVLSAPTCGHPTDDLREECEACQ